MKPRRVILILEVTTTAPLSALKKVPNYGIECDGWALVVEQAQANVVKLEKEAKTV